MLTVGVAGWTEVGLVGLANWSRRELRDGLRGGVVETFGVVTEGECRSRSADRRRAGVGGGGRGGDLSRVGLFGSGCGNLMPG